MVMDTSTILTLTIFFFKKYFSNDNFARNERREYFCLKLNLICFSVYDTDSQICFHEKFGNNKKSPRIFSVKQTMVFFNHDIKN